MHDSKTNSADTNDKSTIDPATQESIEQGKEMIKVQQDQNPAPKEKKDADAKEDAEKWRNEG